MLLAETNARLLADGTLRFQIPGWRHSYFLLSPWRCGFTALCVRGKQTFPAVAWSVAAIPPPGAACEHNADVEAFIAEIPAEARRRVQPYQFGQCLLLSTLAAHEAARDLADSNPNLFWLLGIGVTEGRITADQIPPLCRLKQAEILRVLTRTGTNAQVRFLRKVRVREGTMSGGRFLLEAAGNPAVVHALRHRSQTPIALVEILAVHPGLARDDLVPLIAEKAEECEDAGLAAIARLRRALGFLEFGQAALHGGEFRTRLEEMMRDVEYPPRLVRSALQQAPVPEAPPALNLPPNPFPHPPLRGTRTVVPIRTLAELKAEGLEQRNCAASYAGDIYARRVFLYRVLAPERATLEIHLGPGGPALGQVKLAANRKAGAATIEAVREWLAAARARKKPAPDS